MSLTSSISGLISISDVDSTISVEANATSDTLRNSENALFDSGDGDLRLIVNGTTLDAHKYLIKRFSGLKDRIRNSSITLESDTAGVEDFQNTFKVLYASIIEGPFQFDPITLISALRIATTYGYPALRIFSIKHLEKAPLSAVERIRLAREFGLSSWEEPAYVELCNRDEALTKDEASVLGLDAFVHVARIREKEQRRRGKEVDAVMESDDESQAGEEPTTKTKQARGKKRRAKKGCSAAPGPSSGEGEPDKVKEAPTEADKKGAVGTIPKPSFVEVETVGTHWRCSFEHNWVLNAPGCECGAEISSRQCVLPPCVASAIKHLQTQQLTHGTVISNLETTMERVQATLISLAAPQTHAEPDLRESNQTEGVQNEVRKWLVGVESGTVVA